MTSTMLRPAGVSTAHPGARVLIPAASLTDRIAWLAARQLGTTATDSRVLHGHGYSGESVFKLYLDKTEPVADEGADVPLSWRIGSDMEQLIARYASEELGFAVARVGMLQSLQHPHLLSSPDFNCSCKGHVETKRTHTYYLTRDYVGDFGNRDGYLLPPSWHAQVTHQMLVSGRDHVHVVALVADRDKLTHWTVEAEQGELDTARELADMFWLDHVVPRVPPPISWDTVTRAEMALRHPVGTVAAKTLSEADTEAMRALIRRRQAGKLAGKGNAAELELIENEMRAMIGDAVEVYAADGKTRLVKYGNGTAQSLDLVALQQDHPGLDLTKYRTTTTYRSFNSVAKVA